MPGDDIEKFPALDTSDWRPRPGQTRRRRATALRFFLVILALWICYTLVRAGQEGDQTPVIIDDSAVPAIPPSNPPNAVADSREEEQHDTAVGGSSGAGDNPPAPALKTADYPPFTELELTSSLRKMLANLPDEMQIQSLLRPLETSGEPRLRDLGLRTRHYKALFEAWEAVHLVRGAKGRGVNIRDDIIQSIQRNPEIAKTLDTTTTRLIHSYESFRSVVTRLATHLFPWTAPFSPDHMHLHAQIYHGKRGLVFSAGDNQAPFLLTSIPAIRDLGCDLPIEIMYLGESDLSQDVRLKLEALPGVITRDLSQMVNDEGWKLAGWAGKPFAILHSSFREAIFIDADSLFFQNPETLFDDEAYLENGALFFKDRFMMPESKKKWLQDVLPRPISRKAMESRFWLGESAHMQESGVVVVDKWRHFIALLLVTRMNGPDRDGNKSLNIKGVYDMVYGDKETFWIGWELVGDLDYAFHGGDAGIMGTPEKPKLSEAESTDEDEKKDTINPNKETICAPQLLHLDRSGRPLWFNGWLLPNKFDNGKSREPTNFEAFIVEPRKMQEPGAWELRESNVCCLSAEKTMEFTPKEQEVMKMIIAHGRRVGALDDKT